MRMRVQLNVFVFVFYVWIDISVAQKRLIGSSSKERSNLSRGNESLLRGGSRNEIVEGRRIPWEFEQDDFFERIATAAPTITAQPTVSPAPTDRPTISAMPSETPSLTPSSLPTPLPTTLPSLDPSSSPSSHPSLNPTLIPTQRPSMFPTLDPSTSHSSVPSLVPTSTPTSAPSSVPSLSPTSNPTIYLSSKPSLHPSRNPTDTPSTHPTKPPTAMPTLIPSLMPSSTPSMNPTDGPSQHPSLLPTGQPSPTPSAAPTVSKAPSSTPTISMEPTLVISTTSITQFRIVLTRPPNSPPVDTNEIVDLTEGFLDSYLEKHLPSYMKYRGVDLHMVGSNRRQLQTITTIPCTGEVRFNLFASPDSNIINNMVKRAFIESESKSAFFESLKGSEIAGLETLLDVKATEPSVSNGFNMLHVSLVVISISVVIVGVASSYLWKRTQENNVRKRLLRAAEHTRQYKGQPQLDDDCFKDIEPEPIQISDDNKALERMVMRARHDRGVMNRANEMLLEQAVANAGTNFETNREVRFARKLHEILDEKAARSEKERSIDGSDSESISIDDDTFSEISQFSRGASVATDPNSLVEIGYNDIESADMQSSSGTFSRSQSKGSSTIQSSWGTQSYSLREQSLPSQSCSQGISCGGTNSTDVVDNRSVNSPSDSTLRGDAISLLSQSESVDNGDEEAVLPNNANRIQSGVTQDGSGSTYCTNLHSQY